VDGAGQLYFQGQVISEADLKLKLRGAAGATREPLTLVLEQDKSVPIETTVRLSILAREAGMKDMLLATRPALSQTGAGGHR